MDSVKIGHADLDAIQHEILKAQAKFFYESRTETWGSPKFLVPEGGRRNPGKTRGRNKAEQG